MKKNKIMRLASALLVLTLMTTCAISSTFAKYTTKAEGFDSARVATWGFEDTGSVTLNDLFKTTYDNANVKGNADVIAPGTKNSATFAFDYSGAETAPEVAYTFTVSTDGSTCDTAIQNNKNIVWSLDGTEYATDNTSTSWAKLLAAIEALDGDKVQYAPGELPAKFQGTDVHTVAWEWKYYTDDTADGTDTGMGNAEDLADVTLKITVTATQVD